MIQSDPYQKERSSGRAGVITAWCDTATEYLVLGLVAWLPFAFGGVLPLSHGLVVGVATLAALLFGIKSTLGRAPLTWSWTYVPLLLFVGYVALQIVPLPWSIVSTLSPTAEQWQAMLAAPPLEGGMPAALPLSLYPNGTTQDLSLLLAGAVLLVAIANLSGRERRVERLLGWIAIVGGAVALLGLAQTLLGAEKIYWLVPPPGGIGVNGGPFVHQAHLSQYLNLSIGAALALLLYRVSDRTGRLQHTAQEVLLDLRLPGRAADWALVAMVVLAMLAIAVSRSRNGLLSMCVAGVVIAIVLHLTRILRGVGWLLALMLAAGLVSLLFLGADPVFDRMATLEDPVAAAGTRFALIRDSLDIVQQHPVLGIGHGAFEYVFPGFDTSLRPGRAQHAENIYVELLVETGILGVLLIGAFAVLVAIAWRRCLRLHKRTSDTALAGVLFGVVAVLFHATTDFGLRLPAVAALVTVYIALVVGRIARPLVGEELDGDGPASRPALHGRVFGAAVGFGGAALLALQLPGIAGNYAADKHWRAAKAIETEIQTAEPEQLTELYGELQEHLGAAVDNRPRHAEYLLREAWVHWDRAIVLASLDRDPEAEWTDAELTTLRSAAAEAQRMALEARRHAPTYGMLWSLAGQLGVSWLDQPEAAEWIVRGMELSPESPEACLAAGRQLLYDGDEVAATPAFQRAIAMQAGSGRVLQALVVEAERPDIAAAVARNDVRLLIRLLPMLQQNEDLAELTVEVRRQAVSLLVKATGQSDVPAWMLQQLARFRSEDGDDGAAVALYRRFLAMQPDNPARYTLATILERQGDIEGAKSELRRVLIYRPDYAQAKSRLAELERR